MVKTEKCLRCSILLEKNFLCQSCKSELLHFYEVTKDWQLAMELELSQQTVRRFKRNSGL